MAEKPVDTAAAPPEPTKDQASAAPKSATPETGKPKKELDAARGKEAQFLAVHGPMTLWGQMYYRLLGYQLPAPPAPPTPPPAEGAAAATEGARPEGAPQKTTAKPSGTEPPAIPAGYKLISGNRIVPDNKPNRKAA